MLPAQPRVHSSDVCKKDELKKDDGAPRHGWPEFARTIGQTFAIPELGRILAHRCGNAVAQDLSAASGAARFEKEAGVSRLGRFNLRNRSPFTSQRAKLCC